MDAPAASVRAAARPFLLEAEPPSALNRALDRIAGPRDELFGCRAPSYLVLGVAGVAAAFALLAGLVLRARLPFSISVVLLVASLALFVVAGLVRKAVTGRERHTLLPMVLLVLGAGGAIAGAAGWPVLTVLDLHVLALGVCLAFGRLGCLTAGCCHGRPSRLGIRYRTRDPLSGVRLFPVQLVEALWIALVTAVGSIAVLAGAAPGVTLSFWLISYSSGRFVLEWARGDGGRLRFGPLTGAQWTAVLIVGARIAWEESGRGAVDRAGLGALGGAVALVLIGYAARSRWLVRRGSDLSIDEVHAWQATLATLERAARQAPPGRGATLITPRPGTTLTLVVDRADAGRELHAFTLRRNDAALEEGEAFALAGAVLQRLPAHRVLRASFDSAGGFVVWALVDPSGPAGSTAADDPRLVLLRAQAAAEAARRLPPPAPPIVGELDPALLPPPAEPRSAGVAVPAGQAPASPIGLSLSLGNIALGAARTNGRHDSGA